MEGILKGLRVIEGSAFVAAPLGGMTLAQLGAEVMRFDPIGGGLDYGRWPLTLDGKHSLFWAGLNKGKRSIAVDFRLPRGQELLTQLNCAPGERAGLFSTAVAKVRCGEAATRGTGIAHQLHGAIGFTHEHALHFATKRLWSWREEFGSDAFWAAELGRAAIAERAAGFWPALSAKHFNALT